VKSIQTKILISFCILAIISITCLGIVVSWKFSQSISDQSVQIASDITGRLYETLRGHAQMLDVFIQNLHKDIRRITEVLCTLPTVIANLEGMREKPLIALLQETVEGTDEIDFGLFLTVDGELIASFPTDLRDLAVEDYFASWEFGARVLQSVRYEMEESMVGIVDGISRHTSQELDLLGLDERDISGEGGISLVSAGMIRGDFGDLLGICVIGKLLNQYDKPLKQLYDITGSASVIYLDTMPLAYAGFPQIGQGENPSTLQISPETQADIFSSKKNRQIILPLAGESYLTTCMPLRSSNEKNIGSVCVGVPEATIRNSQQAILAYSSDTKKNVQEWILGIGIGTLGIFVVVSLVIAARIVKPLKRLSDIASVFATGNFQQEIVVRSHDEVGVLANAFRDMMGYVQEITRVADRISNGDLHVAITPRSEQDALNNSLGRMISYIQDVAGITEKISNNDLQVEVIPKSEQDVLNISLQRMVTNLRVTRETIEDSMIEIEQQSWLKTGQAELSNTMRGEQDLPTLARNVITYLANYVHAPIGALYLADEKQVLRLIGSYAYATRKGNRNTFALGEGLVGQAALEKRAVLFTDVPDDYLAITSGLGETAPRYIFVLPFLYENELKGGIEFGTVAELTEIQRDFIEQASENIAIAVHSAQVREKVQALLEQTQQQAEELQTQQEELRATNEELEAQTDALRKSEQRLQTQQEELRQTNEGLEKQAQILEQQQQRLQDNNRELEMARKLLEEKARELERTSQYKSEFLANMSHELRTPLNSLLILSKLLVENKDGNLTDKQIEFAQTIYAGGFELLELINEVLDLSKVEAGKMAVNIEEMSLKGLTSYIEQNFTHVVEKKGVALKVTLADGLPVSISTDRQRVEQILKNLLSNAIKFTHKGEIRVSIDRPAKGMSFSSSGLVPQQTIAIAVSDTGIGIPEAKCALIFEAFHQADGTISRQYGGTGLGLSIVREFTRLLGGEIQVESEEGKGSTFTLYLPEVLGSEQRDEHPDIQGEVHTMKDETQEVHPSAEESAIADVWDDRHDEISSTDKTLLIIEDDPKFAKILFDLARERGFKGLIAGDGSAGLQLAYQYTPSAILLDVGLPGLDGWKVMEKLKQNPETRHIPVHFISAIDQPLDALKMGAVGYLTKPVTIEQLNATFQALEQAIATTLKRLLIVEDDEATRFSMVELLKGDDVEIMTAQTGEEAYQVLEAESFDCLVLDLGLEDMSGLEFLERIHDNVQISHLPVIIYTAKDLTKDEELRLKHHAESIVIKGVKSQERLLDEVTLFLHRIEADLPESQQKHLRLIHDKERVLSGKTLLIVDDDMRNVFALSSVLEGKGMQVVAAEHGQEALDLLAAHPEIDIVLMDIMMPEMDGYEAIGHIRAHPQFSRLPIIALTAKAMKGDRQRCIDAGASDYLSKPVDTDKLLSLLRVWLY
jgi:CheY-like chemotaxis protein/HAMP domain-containing protein